MRHQGQALYTHHQALACVAQFPPRDTFAQHTCAQQADLLAPLFQKATL